MLSTLLLGCLVSGSCWELKAARGTLEILVGLVPVGLFMFSAFAGGVATALGGELVGLGVSLVGQVAALAVLLSIGGRLRSRRMQEVIDTP